MPGLDLAEGASALSMLLLGLLGTGHCVGMCGPLVLALPGGERGLAAHLAYHAGRVTTYAGVGAAVAAVGAGLRHAAHGVGGDPLGSVARVQLLLSLIAGLLLLVLGLARLGVVREPRVLAAASPSALPGFDRLRERAAGRHAALSLFALGAVLGFLPCGLSYAAFSRALVADGVAAGAALAFAFGVGTLPGLLVLGTGAAAFARRHRRLFDVLSGVLLVGMALHVAVDALAALD